MVSVAADLRRPRIADSATLLSGAIAPVLAAVLAGRRFLDAVSVTPGPNEAELA